MYVKCSPTLPLQLNERIVIKGSLGELNEVWFVKRILRNKEDNKQYAFIADVFHETKH